MTKDDCVKLYSTNPEFKAYIDKVCNDSYEGHRMPDIFSHLTVQLVAEYYAHKDEDKVAVPNYIQIEEEDKSC